MAIVARIVVMMIGYCLACIAASTVLTIGALTPVWGDLKSLGLQSAAFWSVALLGAAIVAIVATPPALLAIVLAEGFGWRSSVVYAVLGGMVALSLGYGLDLSGYAAQSGSSLMREREVIAAAGIAGGFVYWLFCGRRAGAWK
jgi:hypothetical protein